ncbi:MAG: CvpA family protein [Planctomycetota bacterium]|jgi:membrane protein required for colicin V production
MQTYDIIMLVVIASATIFGAIKGFAWQVASLASIVASYFVANYFRNDVAKMINAEPPWNMFLAMLLLYFGSSLIIWMVFRMISTSIDKIKLKEFDRQLGAGFGLIKGAALCCILTMFAMTLLGRKQQHAIATSKSGQYIGGILSSARSILPDEVKQVIGPMIANVNKQLEEGRDPNFAGNEVNGLPGGTPSQPWGTGFDGQTNAPFNGWGQGEPNGNAPAADRDSVGGILNRWLKNQGSSGAPTGAGGNPTSGGLPPAGFPSTGYPAPNNPSNFPSTAGIPPRNY